MRVAVVGGGICGLPCAIQILKYFKSINTPIEVTIYSEEFTPNTTGDGSAGLWGPYLLEGTSMERIIHWSKQTHDFLQSIWLIEDAAEAGICLIPCIRVITSPTANFGYWKNIVYGCQTLTQTQLDELNRERETKFIEGLQFVTYTSEPAKLLPYLMKRFQANGGKMIKQKISNLNEFVKNSNFDVVINCTGIGATECAKDYDVYPVRGQVTRVKANWIYFTVLDDSDIGNYIIPNCDSVILGGTHQVNDGNTNVSPGDKKFIIDGCRKFVPGLEHATHLFDWVGLRPGRDSLRLDIERVGKKILIHNYGHGGSGVTLSWGCATDVLELLKDELEMLKLNKSKL